MADRKLWFVHFAQWVSHATGRPIAFLLAFSSIVVWGFTGPLFGFSDTWQLVINTATTIITFLMVFVIQNTQNRDTRRRAYQDRRAHPRHAEGANVLLNLEELDDGDLERLHRDFQKLAKERPHLRLKRAESDETPPERSPKR